MAMRIRWPNNRTLVFFFSYWMVFCVVCVFSGFSDKLLDWMNSLPFPLNWLMFLSFNGIVLGLLMLAAAKSSERFPSKKADTAD